jgi:hypothetical protein
MENTWLIDVLKKLSKKEIDSFVDFVSSPYYNTNKKLITLSIIISKTAPDFTSSKISKEMIFKKIYGNEKYNDAKIRRLISFLFELLEKYLSLNQFEQKPFIKQLYLSEAFNEKGIDKFQTKIEDNLLHILSKESKESRDLNYNWFLYYQEKAENYRAKIIDDEFIKNYLIRFNHFDTFYYTTKLWQYIKLHSIKNIFNITLNRDKEIELLNVVGNSTELLSSSSLLKVYFEVLCIYNNYNIHDSISVTSLLKSIEDNISSFNKNDIRGILFSLAQFKSFLYFKENKNYRQHEEEALSIYKYMDSHHLLKNEVEPLQAGLFVGISVLAIRMRENEWASYFIHKYQNDLPLDLRDNLTLYVNGLLYNGKGDFKQSYSNLNQLKFDSVNMYINTKIIQLINCYELNWIDELYSIINSFNMYIKRNHLKLSDYQNKFIDRFFYYVKKLFEYKLEFTTMKKTKNYKENLNTLQRDININIDNPGVLEWLLAKLSDLQIQR